MVVEAPEFDPNLAAMAAVEYPEGSGVCHALKNSFDGDGNDVEVTECGAVVESDDPAAGAPREEFVKKGFSMCDECWPSEIVE